MNPMRVIVGAMLLLGAGCANRQLVGVQGGALCGGSHGSCADGRGCLAGTCVVTSTCSLARDPAGPCVNGSCGAGSVCVSGNCFGCQNGDCSSCQSSTEQSCHADSDCPLVPALCPPKCADGSDPCAPACHGGQCGLRGCPSVDGGVDASESSCNTPADCPHNSGATCAQTCPDGSNPCTATCIGHQCGVRGCPAVDAGTDGGKSCTTVAECPPNPGATCAQACPDGTNPCEPACLNGQCGMRGCPSGDAGLMCQPIGAACSSNAECCSTNCIRRFGTPGYCCVPGGCP
jgi:hypothetical protein